MKILRCLFWDILGGQVNDAVLTGGNTLVSCSSDATVKVSAYSIYALIFICSNHKLIYSSVW